MPIFNLKGYRTYPAGNFPGEVLGEIVVEAGDRYYAMQQGIEHWKLRGDITGWIKIDELCPLCRTMLKQRPTVANRYFFEWYCPTCDGEREEQGE